MVKALVFGTGAVGSVYGYILYKAGIFVTAVCRSNYSAVSECGTSIKSGLWGEVHYKPYAVRTAEAAASHGPFDFLFVCSKAFPGVAETIKAAVSPPTTIVLAQNGIGIEEEYRALSPQNAIISGVVWLPTTSVAPGVIEMGALERLEIGTYPANAPASHKSNVRQLSGIWTAGGGHAPVCEDIQEARWSKLALNCSFNPMCALSRCDGANLLRSSDDADGIIVKVIRQVATVAGAEGYTHMTEDWIQKILEWHRGSKLTGGKNRACWSM